MAEVNVNQPALSDVAHAQSDELWDAIALLEGARELPLSNQGDSCDRLIRQAIEKIRGVQTAFDPYI